MDLYFVLVSKLVLIDLLRVPGTGTILLRSADISSYWILLVSSSLSLDAAASAHEKE